MARQKRDAYKAVNINLNQKLYDRIAERFHDPITGKPKYGFLSAYLEGLALSDMNAHDKVNSLIEEK